MTQAELVHNIYSENIIDIENRISKSKFPATFQTLRYFSFKIDDMLKSLESMLENENYYSSQALSRILNEHFLVAFYIWTKCRVEKTDECGHDYVMYYPISELFKRVNFNGSLDKSIDPKKFLEGLLKKYPELNPANDPLTAADVQDIYNRAAKFDVRKILKYMQDDLDPNDAFKHLHQIVLRICKEYNSTSSFVHAGRLAEMETFEDRPPVNKIKILENNVATARLISFRLKDFIMMLLLQEDESFINTYQPIIDFVFAKAKDVLSRDELKKAIE